MKKNTYRIFKMLVLPFLLLAFEQKPSFFIYNIVHQMPESPSSKPQKDYYINIGKKNRVYPGTILNVYRKSSSVDNLHQTFVQDAIFLIGYLHVIHSQDQFSIARLKKILSPEKTPLSQPSSISIGDLVEIALDKHD